MAKRLMMRATQCRYELYAIHQFTLLLHKLKRSDGM